MRRFALLVAALTFVAVPAQAGAATDPALLSKLSRHMRAAGFLSGAYVVNLTDGQTVFRWRPEAARILASNTKLFTTAAALARFGTEGTLGTEVLGIGSPDVEGVWRGNLYLRGGGDPTFGSRSFTRRAYGAGARGGRHRPGDRADRRRRIGIRPAARRARLGLRDVRLGRAAERALLQPRTR
jgi:D-alanyl-D-alanine carboxypeptidase/D-alanyl-D-alanine-endopeptidase (penicillin-binding protein 4)